MKRTIEILSADFAKLDSHPLLTFANGIPHFYLSLEKNGMIWGKLARLEQEKNYLYCYDAKTDFSVLLDPCINLDANIKLFYKELLVHYKNNGYKVHNQK